MSIQNHHNPVIIPTQLRQIFRAKVSGGYFWLLGRGNLRAGAGATDQKHRNQKQADVRFFHVMRE